MRKLTQQEIDQAPDGAKYYLILANNVVAYYICKMHISGELTPIPRKEFDIGEYEFSDSDVISVIYQGYETEAYLYFELSRDTSELCHSREDVIAMAKSMNLTAEDLK